MLHDARTTLPILRSECTTPWSCARLRALETCWSSRKATTSEPTGRLGDGAPAGHMQLDARPREAEYYGYFIRWLTHQKKRKLKLSVEFWKIILNFNFLGKFFWCINQRMKYPQNSASRVHPAAWMIVSESMSCGQSWQYHCWVVDYLDCGEIRCLLSIAAAAHAESIDLATSC